LEVDLKTQLKRRTFIFGVVSVAVASALAPAAAKAVPVVVEPSGAAGGSGLASPIEQTINMINEMVAFEQANPRAEQSARIDEFLGFTMKHFSSQDQLDFDSKYTMEVINESKTRQFDAQFLESIKPGIIPLMSMRYLLQTGKVRFLSRQVPNWTEFTKLYYSKCNFPGIS
jgi:hypothetical protein